eukprot:TRINITY_DN13372_c0_g1_i1.p1 TRINITY_DN13372_c0_g1~~TRINITY_DN13372_c0_g1_i1.p1  ORF type:complete len:291 (+),score=104.99 TRINITY_DN13372_c0_g1_i1:180-1052(+)
MDKRGKMEATRRAEEEKRAQILADREEANRRREMEIGRRLEDEENTKDQMEQERLKKAEEEARERKKRIEEQVKRKMEEARQREEQKKKEIEERRQQLEEIERNRAEESIRAKEQLAAEELMRREKMIQNQHQLDEDTDILRGLSDVEDEEVHHHARDHHQAVHHSHHREYESDSGSYSSFNINLQGLSAPIRGPIDEYIDSLLDRFQPQVPIKRTGKKDGVYVYGSRMMRAATNFDDDGYVMVTPQKKVDLQAFMQQYEKVETVRLQGLQAAMGMCSMLNASKGIQLKV